ncbi:MAG: DUF447 domain-containing protein [Methylophilaceae bacterium]
MIFETIITSIDATGKTHTTPFGVRMEGEFVVISPYKPSTTLENILATKHAVMNLTDDVRVFAGALTGRKTWPLLEACKIRGFRLADCLAHTELALAEIREDIARPQLVMKKIHEENHGKFKGFNRAQAAVIELAVLASRVHMLPREKIETELQYLTIAIEKTAGEHEHEAWSWLVEKIEGYYKVNATAN